MGKVLFLILRIVCYLALVLVLSSIVALVVAMTFGECAQGSGGGIDCTSSLAQGVVDAAFGMLLLSVFTGFPALLALGGIFFLIRAIALKNARSREVGIDGSTEASPGVMPSQEQAGVTAASDVPAQQQPRKTIGKQILRVILVAMGVFFLVGVIVGIVQSIGS